jgi:hypothetical protein
MLLGSAGSATTDTDGDLLSDAANLCKIDAKALRTAVAKAEREKVQKKARATEKKDKPAPRARSARK